jgi:hypothetical protein
MNANLHDIRAIDGNSSVILPDDYTEGQSFGSCLRSLGSEGIVYPSVRLPDGECAGLFHPNRGSHPTHKDATSTITGTALGLTFSGMPGPGKYTGFV